MPIEKCCQLESHCSRHRGSSGSESRSVFVGVVNSRPRHGALRTRGVLVFVFSVRKLLILHRRRHQPCVRCLDERVHLHIRVGRARGGEQSAPPRCASRHAGERRRQWGVVRGGDNKVAVAVRRRVEGAQARGGRRSDDEGMPMAGSDGCRGTRYCLRGGNDNLNGAAEGRPARAS